ncbi:50S ribosomal protein L32 [Patescibacteria group bacterium]|nr:50S ribosomal protein L32 [Patescibacteria group bacterium]
MALPAHRSNVSRGKRRRSHLAIKTTKAALCPKCAVPINSHTACNACGHYKGIKVLETRQDVQMKRENKQKRREEKDKEKMKQLKNK